MTEKGLMEQFTNWNGILRSAINEWRPKKIYFKGQNSDNWQMIYKPANSVHTTLELPDMVSHMELLTNCPELPGLKSLGQKMVISFPLKNVLLGIHKNIW